MPKKSTDQFVTTVEGYFSKLPPLPKNWRDVIVSIVPWFALIFGILGVFGSIAALGVLTVFAPFTLVGSGVGVASGGLIGAAIGLVSSGLLLAAFPGTNKRKLSGWNLLFWSEVVSVIASVIAVSVSGVVMALIGLYIIFQIKSHYK